MQLLLSQNITDLGKIAEIANSFEKLIIGKRLGVIV
jgi:hypothetical protein